jgi:hypothetical protein
VIFTDITDSASQVFAANCLLTALPYIIAVILFGLMTAPPEIIDRGGSGTAEADGIMMGAMMLSFRLDGLCRRVALWVTQSVLGVVQQPLRHGCTKSMMRKWRPEKLAAAPSTKAEQEAGQGSRGFGNSGHRRG